MAKTGGSRGARGRPIRSAKDAAARRAGGGRAGPRPGAKAGAKPAAKQPKPAKPAAGATAADAASESRPLEGPFLLGTVAGATPGKWIDTWHDRAPDVEFVLQPIEAAEQRSGLVDGGLDAAIVRLPIDGDGLHVIPLYDERPVVVASAGSHLMAAGELDLADLAGEVVVVPRDDVLRAEVPGGVAPTFAPPLDTEEAIAVVAAGVGVVIVPMSLARLHHRKDADYRVLRDGPISTVALAWPADRTTPEVELFVGIVRGRTANSSR